jgi:hypothetical protein
MNPSVLSAGQTKVLGQRAAVAGPPTGLPAASGLRVISVMKVTPSAN